MISVIIPVYNVEDYLDKCLHSVLTNTYRDLEVICVNDGSTDSCPEILQKWQARDPRVIVVNQKNSGLPGARNSGLEVMTGDYTAFIDADDWVHPQYFAFMLNCMENTDADMVVCGVRQLRLNENVETHPTAEPQYRKLTAKQFFKNQYARRMIWGRLLRRRDTDSLRFPLDVDAHQDTLYNLKLIAGWKQPNVFEIEMLLYFYLDRPDSLYKSRSYDEMIQIADWYVKHERDPHHLRTGEWGSLLLQHTISTAEACRATAYEQNDREVIRHTNALLQTMTADLLSDRYISPEDRMKNLLKCLFPAVYRRLVAVWEAFLSIRNQTE